MAKVDFPDGTDPFFNPAAYGGAIAEHKKAKGAARSRVERFSSLLTEAAKDGAEIDESLVVPPNSEEALRGLLDSVHIAGEDLKSKPIPENIVAYKKCVRNFLRYVVENSYELDERVSGANILKRKKFTLIQVVDRKLEQLAAGILAGQQSQLDLLAKIDEISGLLVDLTR